MLLKYADDQLRDSIQERGRVNLEGDNNAVLPVRQKFKYVDGIERLGDMPLPFLVDLPNGSCEAVFVIASKNAGCGMVPILE